MLKFLLIIQRFVHIRGSKKHDRFVYSWCFVILSYYWYIFSRVSRSFALPEILFHTIAHSSIVFSSFLNIFFFDIFKFKLRNSNFYNFYTYLFLLIVFSASCFCFSKRKNKSQLTSNPFFPTSIIPYIYIYIFLSHQTWYFNTIQISLRTIIIPFRFMYARSFFAGIRSSWERERGRRKKIRIREGKVLKVSGKWARGEKIEFPPRRRWILLRLNRISFRERGKMENSWWNSW